MKKLINDKSPLVYIQWLDSHSDTGWFTRDRLEKFIKSEDCIIEQIGWIVHEDKKISQ